MNISQSTILFMQGSIDKAAIKPAVGVRGYYLELEGRRYSPFNVTRQRGGDCIYKSIDAAYSAANKIGFLKVIISHSGCDLDYL